MKGVAVLVGDTTLQISIPVEAQGSIVNALKFMSLALTVGTSESMLGPLQRSGAGVRSCLVGDILIVMDVAYLLDLSGWVELNDKQLIQIQKISERMLGYDRVRDQFGWPPAKVIPYPPQM